MPLSSRTFLRLPSRSRRRLAALVTAALSVCGCTPLHEYIGNGFKVGPNYSRPPAAVAREWIDAADIRLRQEGNDLAHWWTVFNDPILDGLIADAASQNLTLREAGFRVLAAREELAIAIGFFFPQDQNAAGGYSRQGLSTEVANRQFLIERFYDNWAFGFNLAWELDFWGRFRRAIEAADDDLDASIESYDDVLVSLLGEIAANYVQYRTTEQQIEYAKTNVQLQTESLKIAQARFKSGQSSELDVDQAQGNLSQTESIIPQLEIRKREANNRLCILLGMPPEDLKARLGTSPIPTAPPEVIVGVPADLLERRPDIRQAERQAAAACARIGIAESGFYPKISILGSIGYAAQDFSDLFGSKAFTGKVGPSFEWPLLNYGRILNNVRLKDAEFQQAVTNYQAVVLKANEEVENGIVRFLRSQQRAKSLQEAVKAGEKAVKVALAQYNAGLVDFNRVALLEQNLVSYQDHYAQAQGEIAIGLIQVYRALGGGWQLRLTGEAGPISRTGPKGAPPAPVPQLQPNPAPAAAPPKTAAVRLED